MSAETPEKNQASDPIIEETLVNEMDDFKEMSGAKKSLLFLCVALVISGLTWVILKYAVFIPQNDVKVELEQQRVEQANLAREAEDLKIKNLAVIKLEEQERLIRIKRNSFAISSAIKDKNWELANKYIEIGRANV